ncbi:MAG: mandelate racemase/muconate lactonizing enzyme family protein [Candidatus Binatota bacterium]
MQITDIRTIRLRASLAPERQMHSRSGQRTHRSALLVQVETDEGVTGIGSCSGNGAILEVMIERAFKPLLVGKNPLKVDELWETSYFRSIAKEFGSRGLGVVALSGVDIALWDILGKVKRQPVFQLLGGAARDKVPVYATALYPEEPSEVVKKAHAFAHKGFRAVKIKVGFDLAQDIEIVRAVRAELGKDFTLMTDANQGYTVAVALEAAEAFAACGAAFLEEPLFVEDIAGHASLKAQGKIPIALGDNLHTRFAFDNFIERGAVDILQPDVARAGGISEAVEIAALAARHGLAVSFHTWGDAVALAASLHLAAALKNSSVMELDCTENPLRSELLKEPLEAQNGFMLPPQGAGLGIELDPRALKRFAFSGTEELSPWQKALSA